MQVTFTFDSVSAMTDFFHAIVQPAPITPSITLATDVPVVGSEASGAAQDPLAPDTPPVDPRKLRDDEMVGKQATWIGAKYQATGLVIEAYDNDSGDVVLRIRRDDTGKVLKITFDDNETGKLYLS